MKILWFEVTTPSRYTGQGLVIGGWQDSLERVVRTCPDIELFIAFESLWPQEQKVIDGVTYIPLNIQYSEDEKKRAEETWEVNAEKLIPVMIETVNNIKPDLIQVFGTEWPFGLIAEHTDIPVVIHIQGAMSPYNNAMFPPGYNLLNVFREIGWKHPKLLKKAWKNYKFDVSRAKIDKQVWKAVPFYMGRTDWDEALSAIMHPGRQYFHIEEALRPQFTTGELQWKIPENNQLRLISTGCSNFWKGPDMLIKTAHILKEAEIDFQWEVAGYMPNNVYNMVEQKEELRFTENNITFLGYIQPEVLSKKLCSSNIYVHTAYVENSPNSICEAQCMGVPIVSTNVGGISSLVKNKEQGILVPANDPWQMAYAIISLAKDKDKQQAFSENSRRVALARHDDANIRQQILNVYRTIIKKHKQ